MKGKHINVDNGRAAKANTFRVRLTHYHAYLAGFSFDLLYFFFDQFWPNLMRLLHENLAELLFLTNCET